MTWHSYVRIKQIKGLISQRNDKTITSQAGICEKGEGAFRSFVGIG